MTEILGTGLSGLVGSRVTKLLSSQFSFVNISKETGFDITDKTQITKLMSESFAPWIFHFAAYTSVQGAEDEKDKKEKSSSWMVNVEATATIADICKKMRKKLLYISTDYVFDGEKKEYEETDVPHPVSWYGMTKWEGEKAIIASTCDYCILRIATPYRAFPVGKMDFVHKMLERLKSNQSITAPSDQWFSPTFIDDVAFVILSLVNHGGVGIYHVGARGGITPFGAAQTICDSYNLPKTLVLPVSYDDYYKDKAKAPRQSVLKHDKIDALGLSLHSFQEGMEAVKKEEMQR